MKPARQETVMTRPRTWLRLAQAGALALLAGACAHDTHNPALDLDAVVVRDANTPLGGVSLSQRRIELARARADMVHFMATLDSLQLRRDQNGQVLFKGFVDEYLGTHVDPMLETEMNSKQPELAGLDVSIRFLEAEMLTKLRSPARAQKVINQLERLYEGRADMLVDWPIGKKTPLKKAMDLLDDRKWRG
jgi:hypothetical protein